jgi:hypothetical protein
MENSPLSRLQKATHRLRYVRKEKKPDAVLLLTIKKWLASGRLGAG